MRLTLPYPPKELYPNQAKARAFAGKSAITRTAAAKYRKLVAMSAREQMQLAIPLVERLMAIEGADISKFPLLGPLSVHLTFVTAAKGGRLPDRDNLVAAFKAGFDGLTDAGLWHDDFQVEVVGTNIIRGEVASVHLEIT